MDYYKLKPKQCNFCPLRGEPAQCVVLRTGHVRICGWVDPGSPSFKAGFELQVTKLSGFSRAAEVVDARNSGRYFSTDSPFPPGPDNGKSGTTGSLNSPLPLISDETTHTLVYEGARDCPHKKQDVSCCGPVTRCGEGGVRPGMLVTIRDCYPCSATRLGIEVK
jgi:hypothetical protein